jgi:hypothetical protein
MIAKDWMQGVPRENSCISGRTFPHLLLHSLSLLFEIVFHIVIIRSKWEIHSHLGENRYHCPEN